MRLGDANRKVTEPGLLVTVELAGRPPAGNRPRRLRRPRWPPPRPSGATSPRRCRAAQMSRAPRWPRPPLLPARPRPSHRSRSAYTPPPRPPTKPAISRMAACSEGKSPAHGVDRHDGSDPVAPDDGDVRQEICRAELDLLRVLLEHGLGQQASGHDPMAPRVQLHGPHRRHHHRGVGHEARGPALDVEEALRAHVSPEPGFGDEELAGVIPIRSAKADELPWAMLPKGPACTRTGVFSSVCRRLGLIASRMMTVIAPAAFSCSAVTGSPSAVYPHDDATPCAAAGRVARWRARARPSPRTLP